MLAISCLYFIMRDNVILQFHNAAFKANVEFISNYGYLIESFSNHTENHGGY